MLVYKITNKETDKVYIGLTRKSIESRKNDHIEKSRSTINSKLYVAIATFGADAFKWEQIDTASSINELASKEKEYILKYNSKEEGLNGDCGGGVKKTVHQYDSEGNHINSYSCLDEAGKTVSAKKQQISKACLGNKKSKGFYWSYEYVEKFTPVKDARKKKVFQLTLDGEFINEFDSVSIASKHTGFNKSSIAKVCRGERKSADGFIWIYLNN